MRGLLTLRDLSSPEIYKDYNEWLVCSRKTAVHDSEVRRVQLQLYNQKR